MYSHEHTVRECNGLMQKERLIIYSDLKIIYVLNKNKYKFQEFNLNYETLQKDVAIVQSNYTISRQPNAKIDYLNISKNIKIFITITNDSD